MLSGDMFRLNYLIDDLLSNELTINFNVFFFSRMKQWITSDRDFTRVIIIKWSGFVKKKHQALKVDVEAGQFHCRPRT